MVEIAGFAFVTLLGAALAAFIALERSAFGRRRDIRAHAICGGLAAATGFGYIQATGVNTFDYMVFAGVAAVATAILIRDGAMATAARWRGGETLDVDSLTLSVAIWVGAAAGAGDLRACIFVMLVAAGVAMFRPASDRATPDREALAPAACAAGTGQFAPVSTASRAETVSPAAPALPEYNRGLSPPSHASLFPDGARTGLVISTHEGQNPDVATTPAVNGPPQQEPAVFADTAAQLAALASAIREMTAQTMQVREVFEQSMRLPLHPANARARIRRPSHNVAVRSSVHPAIARSKEAERMEAARRLMARANFRRRDVDDV